MQVAAERLCEAVSGCNLQWFKKIIVVIAKTERSSNLCKPKNVARQIIFYFPENFPAFTENFQENDFLWIAEFL